MPEFTVFPAIDLRQGRVVRLQEGDPARETVFSTDPAEVARRFLTGRGALAARDQPGWRAGRDGGGPGQRSGHCPNCRAGGRVRCADPGGRWGALDGSHCPLAGDGSGPRHSGHAGHPAAADAGSGHCALGAERIAYSLDLRQGEVQIHGWQRSAPYDPAEVLARLADYGLRWVIFTDVQRDGMLTGANLDTAAALARDPRLCVILAGGVTHLEEVRQARARGLAGVIVGRALYTGELDLATLLAEASHAG